VSGDIDHGRRRFLGRAAATIAAGRLGILGAAMPLIDCAAGRLPVEGNMPTFDGATGWLNSGPLKRDALRGKVVLVDFWTYSCINWIRTVPWLRAWESRYRDQGLVMVGVHSPEFTFEKDAASVARATKAMGLRYPIAIDSDHAIWNAFENAYWPALYLVDAQGKIRYHHFGEGAFEQIESNIQRLLVEAGGKPSERGAVSVDARGVEAQADWSSLRSPENYLGYDRTERFVSPGGQVLGVLHRYAIPAQLGQNEWALGGEWKVDHRAIASSRSEARIGYGFHARDLHLVAGPAAQGRSVRFRVSIDGRPPGAAHGVDVDADGNGTMTERRLYQLVRETGRIGDRQFEIVFLDPDVEAFSFTFG